LKTNLYISSGAILLCLTFFGLKAPETSLAKQYCNQRFRYCLDYPASMFPYAHFSPDEDSLLFKTADGNAHLSVIGTATGTKQDSHLAFEQRLRALTSPTPKAPATMLSIINGDDYYEANFLYDGNWYHQKAGFFPTYDVLLTIRVPVNRPEMMVRIKEDVGFAFD